MLFDSNQGNQISVAEQIRRWLKIADLNFRGAYPWVLMAPYIFWLATRFPLERDRLRISVPVLLVGGILFAITSSALTARVVEKKNITVVMTHRAAGLDAARNLLTNHPDVRLENIVSNGYTRIETYTSEVAGVRAKLVVSSSSASGVGHTNGAPMRGTIEPGIETELNAGPTADIDLLKQGIIPDKALAGGGSWFGSARTTARYEAKLFSHLLNVFAYGSLVGLAHAVHFYRRSREREKQAVLLQSHLAQARLHALQAQLQPHFLFNALNAVATLLRRDARLAQEALTSFSELLRLALSQSDKQEVPLCDDLRFVQRYVEIQQTRLGDRFKFEQEIQPETLDCMVPALLLQPLVENALRHGIEPSVSPGLVRVVVARHDSSLSLSVEDNGVGLHRAEGQTQGIGLTNLRARLEALYNGRSRLEVLPGPNGGVRVAIEIPVRRLSVERHDHTSADH